MTYTPFPRDRRQSAYLERSKTARLYAKMLIPVAMLVLSAGVWLDPVLNPRVIQGLEEVKPIVDAVLAGEPISEVLAANRESPGPDAAEEDSEQSGLPPASVAVTRPAG